MARAFESSDEGMAVKTTDGEMVGKVEEIRGNTAHVRPESGLADSIRQKLGWTSEAGDTFELNHSQVDRIDDDGIYLRP